MTPANVFDRSGAGAGEDVLLGSADAPGDPDDSGVASFNVDPARA